MKIIIPNPTNQQQQQQHLKLKHSECPERIKLLIQSILTTKEDSKGVEENILQFLLHSKGDFMNLPKTDLIHYTELLNVIDESLSTEKKDNESSLLPLLQFTRLLLVNSLNRSCYNSREELLQLLKTSKSIKVCVEVLRIFIALFGTPSSTSTGGNSNGKKNLLQFRKELESVVIELLNCYNTNDPFTSIGSGEEVVYKFYSEDDSKYISTPLTSTTTTSKEEEDDDDDDDDDVKKESVNYLHCTIITEYLKKESINSTEFVLGELATLKLVLLQLFLLLLLLNKSSTSTLSSAEQKIEKYIFTPNPNLLQYLKTQGFSNSSSSVTCMTSIECVNVLSCLLQFPRLKESSGILSLLNIHSTHHNLLTFTLNSEFLSADSSQDGDMKRAKYVDSVVHLILSLVVAYGNSGPSGSTSGSNSNVLLNSGLLELLLKIIKDFSLPSSKEVFYRTLGKCVGNLDTILYALKNSLGVFMEAGGLELVLGKLKSVVLSGEDTKEKSVEEIGFVKNVLKLLLHLMTTNSNDRLIRNLLESCLVVATTEKGGVLRVVMENRSLYGNQSVAICLNIMATFLHEDPSCFSLLAEKGLVELFVFKEMLSYLRESGNGDLLGAIVYLIGALCLQERGMEMIQKQNPFDEFIVEMFTLICSPSNSFNSNLKKELQKSLIVDDLASFLGNAFDELMRHHPQLKDVIMKAVYKLVQRVAEVGSTSKVAENVVGKVLVEDEEKRPFELHTRDSPPNGDLKEYPIILLIDQVSRFLEGIFQTTSHAEYFLSKFDEPLEVLFSWYRFPTIPYDFAQTSASYNMSHVFRELSEVPNGGRLRVLKLIVTGLENQYDKIKVLINNGEAGGRNEEGKNQSVIATHFTTFESKEDITPDVQQVFRDFIIYHSYLGLLSDLYSSPVYAAKTMSDLPSLVQLLSGKLHVLQELFSVYRMCALESLYLKHVFAQQDSATVALKLKNVKYWKFLLSQTTGFVAPTLQGIANIIVPKKLPSVDFDKKEYLKSVESVASELIKGLKENFSSERKPQEPLSLKYHYLHICVELVNTLITDERNPSLLIVCMVEAFVKEEGLDLLLQLTDELVLQDLTQEPHCDRAYSCLESILNIFLILVNNKSLTEQNHHLSNLNNLTQTKFDTKEFLVNVRYKILNHLLNTFWNKNGFQHLLDLQELTTTNDTVAAVAGKTNEKKMSCMKNIINIVIICIKAEGEDLPLSKKQKDSKAAAVKPGEDRINQLIDMGFSREVAIEALRENGNSVMRAAEQLLLNPSLLSSSSAAAAAGTSAATTTVPEYQEPPKASGGEETSTDVVMEDADSVASNLKVLRDNLFKFIIPYSLKTFLGSTEMLVVVKDLFLSLIKKDPESKTKELLNEIDLSGFLAKIASSLKGKTALDQAGVNKLQLLNLVLFHSAASTPQNNNFSFMMPTEKVETLPELAKYVSDSGAAEKMIEIIQQVSEIDNLGEDVNLNDSLSNCFLLFEFILAKNAEPKKVRMNKKLLQNSTPSAFSGDEEEEFEGSGMEQDEHDDDLVGTSSAQQTSDVKLDMKELTRHMYKIVKRLKDKVEQSVKEVDSLNNLYLSSLRVIVMVSRDHLDLTAAPYDVLGPSTKLLKNEVIMEFIFNRHLIDSNEELLQLLFHEVIYGYFANRSDRPSLEIRNLISFFTPYVIRSPEAFVNAVVDLCKMTKPLKSFSQANNYSVKLRSEMDPEKPDNKKYIFKMTEFFLKNKTYFLAVIERMLKEASVAAEYKKPIDHYYFCFWLKTLIELFQRFNSAIEVLLAESSVFKDFTKMLLKKKLAYPDLSRSNINASDKEKTRQINECKWSIVFLSNLKLEYPGKPKDSMDVATEVDTEPQMRELATFILKSIMDEIKVVIDTRPAKYPNKLLALVDVLNRSMINNFMSAPFPSSKSSHEHNALMNACFELKIVPFIVSTIVSNIDYEYPDIKILLDDVLMLLSTASRHLNNYSRLLNKEKDPLVDSNKVCLTDYFRLDKAPGDLAAQKGRFGSASNDQLINNSALGMMFTSTTSHRNGPYYDGGEYDDEDGYYYSDGESDDDDDTGSDDDEMDDDDDDMMMDPVLIGHGDIEMGDNVNDHVVIMGGEDDDDEVSGSSMDEDDENDFTDVSQEQGDSMDHSDEAGPDGNDRDSGEDDDIVVRGGAIGPLGAGDEDDENEDFSDDSDNDSEEEDHEINIEVVPQPAGNEENVVQIEVVHEDGNAGDEAAGAAAANAGNEEDWEDEEQSEDYDDEEEEEDEYDYDEMEEYDDGIIRIAPMGERGLLSGRQMMGGRGSNRRRRRRIRRNMNDGRFLNPGEDNALPMFLRMNNAQLIDDDFLRHGAMLDINNESAAAMLPPLMWEDMRRATGGEATGSSAADSTRNQCAFLTDTVGAHPQLTPNRSASTGGRTLSRQPMSPSSGDALQMLEEMFQLNHSSGIVRMNIEADGTGSAAIERALDSSNDNAGIAVGSGMAHVLRRSIASQGSSQAPKSAAVPPAEINYSLLTDQRGTRPVDLYNQECRIFYNVVTNNSSASRMNDAAMRVKNEIFNRLQPEALKDEEEELKKKKEKEEEELKKKEEEAAKKREEEAAKKKALEAAEPPKEEAEPSISQEQDTAQGSSAAQPPAAEAPANPNTVTIFGTPIDLTNTGIDPTFLEALPDDLRTEVLIQHLRQQDMGGSNASGSFPPGASFLGPNFLANNITHEFLEALPEDIREEIIQQEELERQRQQGTAVAVGGNPLNLGSVGLGNNLANELLRQMEMMIPGFAGQGDGPGAQLLNALIGSAQAGNGQAVLDIQIAGRDRTDGASITLKKEPKDEKPQAEPLPLVDSDALSIILQLLLHPNSLPRKQSLNELLYCFILNSTSRAELLTTLLTIIYIVLTHNHSGTINKFLKSFFQHAGMYKRVSAEFATFMNKYSTTPATLTQIVQKCFDILTYLTKNEFVPKYFLCYDASTNTMVSPVSASSPPRKRKDKLKYPLLVLMMFMELPSVLQNPQLLESLTSLIAHVSSLIAKEKTKIEKEKEASAKSGSATSSTSSNELQSGTLMQV